MATSGTTSFSVTELDIITDAMQNIGAIGAAETAVAAEDYVVARRKLNMLIKQWTAQIDFAPGLKMWTRRRGFLFLQSNQVVYSLGQTGDECAADSYVTSTLASSAAGGAGTITLVSGTGFVSGMRVGIVLDSGSIQWVLGTVSGATVTLGSTLTSAASAGARVFGYTSKIQRPFEIVTASLRDTHGDDTPMGVSARIEDYEAIVSKTAPGAPQDLYFEAQRTNAKVYLDCQPSDLTDVIRFVYLAYVEDMSATTNDVDFPAEWYRALTAQLTIDLCVPFQRSVTQDMKEYASQALLMAKNAYPERSGGEYQNCPDDY